MGEGLEGSQPSIINKVAEAKDTVVSFAKKHGPTLGMLGLTVTSAATPAYESRVDIARFVGEQVDGIFAEQVPGAFEAAPTRDFAENELPRVDENEPQLAVKPIYAAIPGQTAVSIDLLSGINRETMSHNATPFLHAETRGFALINPGEEAALVETTPDNPEVLPQELAIGYSGTVYTYDPEIHHYVPYKVGDSIVHVPQQWEGLKPLLLGDGGDAEMIRTLVEYNEGTKHMNEIGFAQPSYIDPECKTPFVSKKEFEVDRFGGTAADFAKEKLDDPHNPIYFVTNQGTVMDVNHAREVAESTLKIYEDITKLVESGAHEGEIEVGVGIPNVNIRYHINVDKLDKNDKNEVIKAALGIAYDRGFRVESVSQAGIESPLPSVIASRFDTSGGLASEDLAVNTLAATEAANVIMKLRDEQATEPVDGKEFGKDIVEKIINDYGVLDVDKTVLEKNLQHLPKGMYHFSPIRVIHTDTPVKMPEPPVKPLVDENIWFVPKGDTPIYQLDADYAAAGFKLPVVDKYLQKPESR